HPGGRATKGLRGVRVHQLPRRALPQGRRRQGGEGAGLIACRRESLTLPWDRGRRYDTIAARRWADATVTKRAGRSRPPSPNGENGGSASTSLPMRNLRSTTSIAARVLWLALFTTPVRAADPPPDPRGVEFFERKIRPVL